MIIGVNIFVLFLIVLCGCTVMSNKETAANRLHFELMTKRGYNKLIKPSINEGKLTVKLGMRLSQILNVDEKNQIMTISVWLRQQWEDMRLNWSLAEFDNILELQLPPSDLWRPDIVLYNNADGTYVVTLPTKATVYHTGTIVWEPPVIYKSYCPIDVEYFPFDIQECFLKFGTWSYDGNQVDLQHICEGVQRPDGQIVIARGIDLKDYYYNVEWDIINVTARRKVKYYPCCDEPYPDITFNITLRRRTLFYSVNLIMPCISISCLTILVFFLPADSRKKITLSIYVLLALTVFFLLLADLIPPTSLVIPLIGKYLLFIMIVVTMSIFLTVYTLHIHFKTPATHKMSPWIRRVFTEILPKILLVQRPALLTAPVLHLQPCNGVGTKEEGSPVKDWHTYENLRQRLPPDGQDTVPKRIKLKYPKEVSTALIGVRYMANRTARKDDVDAEIRDWKYIAMVMDRLFLYIFAIAYFIGTISIFLYAPSLYDPREPMALVDYNSSCMY